MVRGWGLGGGGGGCRTPASPSPGPRGGEGGGRRALRHCQMKAAMPASPATMPTIAAIVKRSIRLPPVAEGNSLPYPSRSSGRRQAPAEQEKPRAAGIGVPALQNGDGLGRRHAPALRETAERQRPADCSTWRLRVIGVRFGGEGGGSLRGGAEGGEQRRVFASGACPPYMTG